MPKTSAESTRDNVLKYRDAGLIQTKTWVHPDEAKALRNAAQKLPKTKRIREKLTSATKE